MVFSVWKCKYVFISINIAFLPASNNVIFLIFISFFPFYLIFSHSIAWSCFSLVSYIICPLFARYFMPENLTGCIGMLKNKEISKRGRRDKEISKRGRRDKE